MFLKLENVTVLGEGRRVLQGLCARSPCNVIF